MPSMANTDVSQMRRGLCELMLSHVARARDAHTPVNLRTRPTSFIGSNRFPAAPSCSSGHPHFMLKRRRIPVLLWVTRVVPSNPITHAQLGV